MANHSHFIIPFASSLDDACYAAIKTLALPNLARFFKQAELVNEDVGDEFDFIPPHERVLELTDQVIVTPCHWSVGIDNIRMDDPADLQLIDAESRALFAVVLPYFLEDDIALTYEAPLRWLAASPVLQGLALASLDRVMGRNVDVWQPQSEDSKAIRRLQNEMQMLLYTHPINEVREARGLPTVNSFWLSRQAKSDARFDFSLQASALRGDWLQWVHGWQAISDKLFKSMALASQSGCGLQLTLCGERNAHTYVIPAKRNFSSTMRRLFKPAPSIQSVLLAL